MNKFQYEVSFRVFHADMNPNDICQKLNMQAAHKWCAGEQRRTPKGTSLPGVYDQSYCSFKLDQPKDTELVDFLKHWNDKLINFRDFFNQIYSSGGRLEYFIGWYYEGNSGEVFDVSLLEELVELKIDLAIDFYGGSIKLKNGVTH